jgi:uncharacterized protein YdiU (UPF0061 family)
MDTETIGTKTTGAKTGWNLDNSYARLPESFFSFCHPTPVRSPKLAVLNNDLARSLGLDPEALSGSEGAEVFAGNRIPEGSQPLAQAYAGHQFGYFTMLGDGRAVLLGEQITPSGMRYDIQLKGCGRTPYSRGGDGRAVIGPMLREYIISEAMHALGIPTTRSLAVVTTGETVYRKTALPGAVLTRVAASHIRVGTFEYASRWCTADELKILADYTIERHFSYLIERHLSYPEGSDRICNENGREGNEYRCEGSGYRHEGSEYRCEGSDNGSCFDNTYLRLLKEVVRRQAELIAKWQLAGFIHGVMNTDNMALSGETIDYGPCAFMDAYDPGTVFSSIDIYGRYAYGNQPGIAAWNLARFAETLLPLLHEDENRAVVLAQDAVSEFGELFRTAWLRGMRAKLGIFTGGLLDEEHQDEIPQGEVLQNEAPQDEVLKDKAPQDEVPRDEDSRDEALQDKGSRDEALQDEDLFNSLLDIMHRHKADFTNTFRALTYDEDLDIAMFSTDEFKRWKARWHERLGRQQQAESSVFRLMRESNPVIIPRNHRVEEALKAAEKHGDYSVMERLVRALSKPYENTPDKDYYTAPPGPSFCGYRTFCGT